MTPFTLTDKEYASLSIKIMFAQAKAGAIVEVHGQDELTVGLVQYLKEIKTMTDTAWKKAIS